MYTMITMFMVTTYPKLCVSVVTSRTHKKTRANDCITDVDDRFFPVKCQAWPRIQPRQRPPHDMALTEHFYLLGMQFCLRNSAAFFRVNLFLAYGLKSIFKYMLHKHRYVMLWLHLLDCLSIINLYIYLIFHTITGYLFCTIHQFRLFED